MPPPGRRTSSHGVSRFSAWLWARRRKRRPQAPAESASLLAVSAMAAVGLLVLVALGVGAFTLLRRAHRATNEVKRLNALLDVLDEGVAVCSGMQTVAVNTSLCRLIGIEARDAQHLMISSFIADADAIDRLLGEGELRLDTDITNRAGRHHRGRDRGTHDPAWRRHRAPARIPRCRRAQAHPGARLVPGASRSADLAAEPRTDAHAARPKPSRRPAPQASAAR